MLNVDCFQTKRLSARPIQADDFRLLSQMHQNPQVMATLGGLRTDEETRQFLDSQLEHWRARHFGLWMFFSRDDGQFVGRGGLKHVQIEGQDEVEVGYALWPQFWNRGLATELATASVKCAFTELDLAHLVCFTLPTNFASRRVMEKCGFRFDRDFIWKQLPHVLYRLRREEWRQSR